MTKTEIEARFKGMMLDHTHIGNKEGARKNGYWSVPVEEYKFKIIPGAVRDEWAIKIESADTQMSYSAEAGIQWIQDLIRDKMEEQVDRTIYSSISTEAFIHIQIKRQMRKQDRLMKQLFTNPSYKKAKWKEK